MNCLRNTQKKKCMSKEKLWGTPKQTIGDHLPHEKTRTILGYLSIYPCRNSTNFDRPLGPCPCHESSELCYILPERWRDSCTQKIDPNCGCRLRCIWLSKTPMGRFTRETPEISSVTTPKVRSKIWWLLPAPWLAEAIAPAAVVGAAQQPGNS